MAKPRRRKKSPQLRKGVTAAVSPNAVTIDQYHRAWMLFYGGVDRETIRKVVGLTMTQFVWLLNEANPAKGMQPFLVRMREIDAEAKAQMIASAKEMARGAVVTIAESFRVVEQANRITFRALSAIESAVLQDKEPPEWARKAVEAVRQLRDISKPAQAARAMFGGEEPVNLHESLIGTSTPAYREAIEETGAGLEGEELVAWMSRAWTMEELDEYAKTGREPERFRKKVIDVDAAPTKAIERTGDGEG